MRILIIFSFLLFTISIQAQQKKTVVSWDKNIKGDSLTEAQEKNWQHLDIEKDTIPGISLDRVYKELLRKKKGKDIIVAVLDTKVDIFHEDLQQQVYVNVNEIPNNKVDDDGNGYIDDIHGWNFLGSENGKDILYQKNEITRFIEKYKPIVSDTLNPLSKDSTFIEEYKQLEKEYDVLLEKTTEDIEYAYKIIGIDTAVKRALAPYFESSSYTLEDLDALKNKFPDDKDLHSNILKRSNFIKYNITEEYLYNTLDGALNNKKLVNPLFNERVIINDSLINFTNRNYGNPIVYGKVPFEHSIAVSGIMAANRSNGIGILGVSDHIKIMPVVMVASGDEHDKDVATAIRYAVDNGASIINMSWGKKRSLYKEKIFEAIRYAEERDVLLVTAGGNNNEDNDVYSYYPNDYDNGNEFASNFIVVGASSYDVEKLKASFSNYGTSQVDIFAPGDRLYSTSSDNEFGDYDWTSGTSLASPIVSGVAALIRSHYPSLKASEVKQILMDSAVKYDILVDVPTKENPEQQLPFSELSKSGGIVNAYNAMLMAEAFVKRNKK
ncbi:S8 family serine peptidase [uncultured Dokdonia sp.]|uniref:S8 family serine peptidase n=1 Tax=uncultured Dokdonia sp. TaxID=575653 RepID=UPI00260C120A|nr:S8 family serine peptidase [uncultured Dokdonia sp.]